MKTSWTKPSDYGSRPIDSNNDSTNTYEKPSDCLPAIIEAEFPGLSGVISA